MSAQLSRDAGSSREHRASKRRLADIQGGVMLRLVRVRSRAPLRRHPRAASRVRPPHARVGGRLRERSRRRRPRGVRPAAPQGWGIPRPAIRALVALRRIPPAGQQPSPRKAAGRVSASGLVAPGGPGPRRPARGSHRPRARRPGGSSARPGRGHGVHAGRAGRPPAPRSRRRARAQRQHHALARAAGALPASSGPHARRRDPGHRLRSAREHLQHRAHRRGGVR